MAEKRRVALQVLPLNVTTAGAVLVVIAGFRRRAL